MNIPYVIETERKLEPRIDCSDIPLKVINKIHLQWKAGIELYEIIVLIGLI